MTRQLIPDPFINVIVTTRPSKVAGVDCAYLVERPGYVNANLYGKISMNMAFRYWLDRRIRAFVMRIMGLLTARTVEQQLDWRRQEIRKILLVRSIFRMGDAILATPAILLFRKNFPQARIDFVGPGISKSLFLHLPINAHYEVYQSFPKVCWSYLTLLRQIRHTKYDLAVDVSGSSAALGSFIVGFSGARFRVGLKGKWDRWFNVRLRRPLTVNKYRNLPELVGSMGLETELIFPTLVLSPEEIEEGRKRIQALIHRDEAPIVGVFVGGRKTRGKRWARENFLKLVTQLRAEGARSIIFVGPEERKLIPYFRGVLGHRVPVLFEPNARSFAALLANCHLFVACDSGPVHLACALGVRTVAIFLKDNFDRWGPPADLGRIVYREGGVSAEDVLEACHFELADLSIHPHKCTAINE
jgi:heptosyltransferase-3